MKEKMGSLDTHKWIVLGIIIVFVLIGSLTGILFPGTAFATVVDNSIGKFFDVFSIFKNNYINILESITIILFMAILFYVISVIVKLVTRKNNRVKTIGVLLTSIA